jgi:hypothetical protein
MRRAAMEYTRMRTCHVHTCIYPTCICFFLWDMLFSTFESFAYPPILKIHH